MEWASEKWGGIPHYRGAVRVLGEDEHGTWLWGVQGRTITRGVDESFTTEQATIALVPRDDWWSPAWWLGHPTMELYVNINTPAVWEPHRVVCVDLDLDVVRYTDGRVEIVDRDEFEVHQVQYGYPPDVIAAAELATAVAYERVCDRVPPFDGTAANAWAGRADQEPGARDQTFRR